METENTQSTPLGFILIATFWIFLGVLLLSMTSGSLSGSSYSLFLVIPLFMSIGLILLGWGLLTLKKWAYYITLVLSILGLFSLFFAVPSVIYIIIGHYYGIASFFPLIYFLFIPMVWYLFKNRGFFISKHVEKPARICPSCGRSIPFDANLCPYCERRFESII
jgi:hypothetical protein